MVHARARERQLASLEGTSARESRLGTVISREKPGRNPGASRITGMAEQPGRLGLVREPGPRKVLVQPTDPSPAKMVSGEISSGVSLSC
jgi:hypothetical protein